MLVTYNEQDDLNPLEFKFDPNKKYLLTGIPGAFTPICTSMHLPGYAYAYDEILKLGIEEILFISTNDPWTMKAWNEMYGRPELTMVSDPSGEFLDRYGLLENWPHMGTRSKRFASVVYNGEIIMFRDALIQEILLEVMNNPEFAEVLDMSRAREIDLRDLNAKLKERLCTGDYAIDFDDNFDELGDLQEPLCGL